MHNNCSCRCSCIRRHRFNTGKQWSLELLNKLFCLSVCFHYANMTKWQLVTLCLAAKPSPRDVARFSDEEKKKWTVSLKDETQPKLCEAGRSTRLGLLSPGHNGQKSPANNKNERFHNRSHAMLTSPRSRPFHGIATCMFYFTNMKFMGKWGRKTLLHCAVGLRRSNPLSEA